MVLLCYLLRGLVYLLLQFLDPIGLAADEGGEIFQGLVLLLHLCIQLFHFGLLVL